MTTYAVVGKPVTREDGPEKVSGKTCYSGDLRLPGMLWGKVLRSPFPHARIVRMETSGHTGGFRGALTLSGGRQAGAGPIAFPTFGSIPI